MEVEIKIISLELSFIITFLNCSISAVTQFKTFLRPLFQKCQKLKPF